MLVKASALLLVSLISANALGHGFEKRRCDAAKTVTATVWVNAAAGTGSSSSAAPVVSPTSNRTTSNASKSSSTPAASGNASKTNSSVSSSSSRSSGSSAPASAPTSPNNAGSLKTSYTGKTSGTATFYGDDGSGGTCKLPARKDLAFVAWPGAQWNDAEYCGMCLNVKGDKGSINVQVTNKCPECNEGSLDMSTTAFHKIISTSGVGPISWTPVSCVDAGLETGKLTYFWKSGSSQYYAGIQVRGGAAPIASVAVAPMGSSSFTTLPRQDFNYFVASGGLGAGPFQIKTTFQDGTVKTDTNVPLNGNIENA